MTESLVCNVCGSDDGTEYELRLDMSEGGHREVSIALCDFCADEYLDQGHIETLSVTTNT